MVAALAMLVVALLGVIVFALGTDTHGARVIHFTVHSRFVPGAHTEALVVPAHSDGAGRPLLVFLHGRGEDADSNLSAEVFAALASQGADGPDIVFPDGGEASYWHDRRDGAWGRYVLEEVLPAALARLCADGRRVAIGGLSMGGFGALDIAAAHPGRFCAVGADSAALWFRGADSAAGAFDDAADFARHDLLGAAARGNPFGATPVWLDVGREDPFRSADLTLARSLRRHRAHVSMTVWPGGHGSAYWRAHWGSYLAFYTRALKHCQ